MKRRSFLLALLLLLFFSGCAGGQAKPVGGEAVSDVRPRTDQKPLAAARIAPIPAPTPAPVGSGRLEGAEAAQLPAEAAALLKDFFDRYYDALARLEEDEGFADLFEEENEAAAAQAVLAYAAGIRRLQAADLSLTGYRYTLYCRETENPEEEDTLSLLVMEDGVQNFAAYPGVDSEYFNVPHTFVLAKTANGWKIRSHMQWDTLFYIAVGVTDFSRDAPNATQEDFHRRIRMLLRQAEENMALRGGEEALPTAAEHPYDREAAVAYADSWVTERNDDWADYGFYGGNCQNYASQCLLAGGIPMDIYGPYVWKWYGDTPNDRAGARGRSASWSGVEEFMDYARQNGGYGLAARQNAPFDSGEPGDLIHMGREDGWHHTVVIVRTITADDGEVLDYLVDSNTADLKNWPASAYHYSRQSLTKIFGWNEGA